MTLAVMGYHFQVMTIKLSRASGSLALLPTPATGLPAGNGEQAR